MFGFGFDLWGASLDKGVGLLPITPANDTPIITGGLGSVAFSTQTTHTLKRLGDNTTNVDTAGDTKFRYPGVPDNVLVPNAINSRVGALRIPGGNAQARSWDHSVETLTSSKFYGLNFVSPTTNASFLIIVNGRVVNGAATHLTTGAGNANFLLLEFPDRTPRRIKLVFPGVNVIMTFQTEAAYPPVRPTGNDKVLLAIGDSLSAGAGGVPPAGATAVDTWPQYIALMLGFDHCCNASIGGTKWVPGGAGDVAISHFGGGRIAPALTTNPSAVVFAGSRNDSSADQAAVDAIIAAVGDALDLIALPKFVMGTFTPLTGVNNAVSAGAAAKGVPFIDMTDGLQVADLGGDSVHPTYAGAVNLRNRMAPRLRAAGCVG